MSIRMRRLFVILPSRIFVEEKDSAKDEVDGCCWDDEKRLRIRHAWSFLDSHEHFFSENTISVMIPTFWWCTY